MLGDFAYLDFNLDVERDLASMYVGRDWAELVPEEERDSGLESKSTALSTLNSMHWVLKLHSSHWEIEDFVYYFATRRTIHTQPIPTHF